MRIAKWVAAAALVAALAPAAMAGVVRVNGDNVWSVFINGTLMDEGDNWQAPTITSFDEGGAATIAIYVHDAEPGAAGVGGFLADVVQSWEAECLKAEEAGIRVVCLRMGAVLSPDGGALAKLLPVFRAGAGGPVGSGLQWFPWIHIDDAAAAFEWAVRNSDARGIYNAVSPGLLRQRAFSDALGAALRRPAVVPAPALAIRMAFGQMGSEMLLSGQRAEPRRLLGEGFEFQWGQVGPALDHLLG